jgi:hypothetical protein
LDIKRRLPVLGKSRCAVRISAASVHRLPQPARPEP